MNFNDLSGAGGADEMVDIRMRPSEPQQQQAMSSARAAQQYAAAAYPPMEPSSSRSALYADAAAAAPQASRRTARPDGAAAADTDRSHMSRAQEMANPVYGNMSGFRNIQPMSRSERLALKDKVALEKDRLWKRTGWQARLYRENAPRHGSMGLTAMEPNAAGFLADADRFHSDVSGEEYLSRMKKYDKTQASYARKRVERADQDAQRWAKIDQDKNTEEAYWQDQREQGVKCRKNRSAVPYNTITLTYNHSHGGEELRHSDEKVRWRAERRSQNLDKWGGSRCGYNILTGSRSVTRDEPARPIAPTDHHMSTVPRHS